MADINVTITTKKQSLPASPAAGFNNKWTLLHGTVAVASQTLGTQALTATFTGVADGDYTVSVQRLAMDGSTPLGTPAVSAPFTVVNMALVDVPDMVTVGL